MKTNTAKFIKEIVVKDPDTNAPVPLAIYKDQFTGTLFGIDSIFIDQLDVTEVPSLYYPEQTLILTND